MAVYGPGNTMPMFWTPELDKAKGIMHNCLELPKASKERCRLNTKGFLRQALKKMGKRFESYKVVAS